MLKGNIKVVCQKTNITQKCNNEPHFLTPTKTLQILIYAHIVPSITKNCRTF